MKGGEGKREEVKGSCCVYAPICVLKPLTDKLFFSCGCIKPTIFPVLSAFQPPNSTHMTMQQSSTHS